MEIKTTVKLDHPSTLYGWQEGYADEEYQHASHLAELQRQQNDQRQVEMSETRLILLNYGDSRMTKDIWRLSSIMLI